MLNEDAAALIFEQLLLVLERFNATTLHGGDLILVMVILCRFLLDVLAADVDFPEHVVLIVVWWFFRRQRWLVLLRPKVASDNRPNVTVVRGSSRRVLLQMNTITHVGRIILVLLLHI